MKTIPEEYFVWSLNQNTADFLQKTAAELRVRFGFQRNSKLRLGSFRAIESETFGRILIQRGLPSGQMLIVLCHELAHAMVWRQYGRRARSHGDEWKFAYTMLLKVATELYLFDDDWKPEVQNQINKPKATYKLDTAESIPGENECFIGDLADGERFFYKGTEYKRLKLNRTRILCQRLPGRKRYLFQAGVIVGLQTR